MNFCSDNVSGVSPEILTALGAANNGPAMPYGADEVTERVIKKLRELFEAPAAEVGLLSPFGAIYCHPDSHVNVDECGAPEFFSGGAKLVTVGGADGKMPADALEAACYGAAVVPHVLPAAVSVTQVTEAGTIYASDELRAISTVCKTHGLKLHMDGARFANAIEAMGISPAACSHGLGVDALSFGATKNGAMCAEASLFFDSSLAKEAGYRRKRGGHLFSKMRYLSAQFDAYLADDLWRRNARHSNTMATRLATGLSAISGVEFAYPVEANELFVRMPVPIIEGLLADGFLFYRWEPEGSLIRMVTTFDTAEADVELFIETARRLAS